MLYTLPGSVWILDISRIVGQDRHLLGEPWLAAILLQRCGNFLVYGAEKNHVVQRVFQLAFAQGPQRPVAVLRRLVYRRARQRRRQSAESDLLPESAHHRGDLGVVERTGYAAVQLEEYLKVLASGVEHFENSIIRQQIEQWRQIHVLCHRIDRDGAAIGSADLDET